MISGYEFVWLKTLNLVLSRGNRIILGEFEYFDFVFILFKVHLCHGYLVLTLVVSGGFEGSFGDGSFGMLTSAFLMLTCCIILFSTFLFIIIFYIVNKVRFRGRGEQIKILRKVENFL